MYSDSKSTQFRRIMIEIYWVKKPESDNDF